MKNKKAIILLFIANTISGISQGISLIAIPWYISNDLNKPGLYGSLFFIVTLLSLFWGPYAGTLIDKYDRKKVMMAIQSVGLLVVAGIALMAKFQNYTAVWMAAGVMIATKLIYNIHYPNLYAFAQEIVEKENYGKISSWLEVQGQTTFILSGALAAFLMEGKFGGFHFTPWPIYDIFLLDASTYILGLFILGQITYHSLVERKHENTSFFIRTKEGFIYLKERPLILLFGVVAGFVFASILVCSFFTMPIFIKNVMHGSESTYGITEAAFAAGSLVSGMAILKIFKVNRLTLGIICLGLLAATMFFFIGYNHWFIVLYVAYAFIGFANAGIRVLRTTFIFRVIDNNIIGRTGSIFMIFNVLFRLVFIALFSLPFFARDENMIYSMYILAIFILLGTIILILSYSKLRKLNATNYDSK